MLLPLLDPSTGRGSLLALSADGQLTGPLHEAPGLEEVYAVDGHVLISTDSELVCFRPAARPSPSTTRQH